MVGKLAEPFPLRYVGLANMGVRGSSKQPTWGCRVSGGMMWGCGSVSPHHLKSLPPASLAPGQCLAAAFLWPLQVTPSPHASRRQPEQSLRPVCCF